MIRMLFLLAWFGVMKDNRAQNVYKMTINEPRFFETALNQMYIGGAKDVVYYQSEQAKKGNLVNAGLIRTSIRLKSNIQLLIQTEYLYKTGMIQNFMLTPLIGLRKKF
jgi:hypothetical protein